MDDLDFGDSAETVLDTLIQQHGRECHLHSGSGSTAAADVRRADDLLAECDRVIAEGQLARLLGILQGFTDADRDYNPQSSPRYLSTELSPQGFFSLKNVATVFLGTCSTVITNRCPKCDQKNPRSTISGSIYTVTGLSELRELCRRHRGCAGGLCCVYSMWNDPAFLGHGGCAHECKISRGRFAHCGPSIFETNLFAEHLNGHSRGNQSRCRPQHNGTDPELLRNNFQVYRRRRKASNSVPCSTIPPHAPLDNNSSATVAGIRAQCPRIITKRQKKNVSIVQRIRKRMGQRSFGKL